MLVLESRLPKAYRVLRCSRFSEIFAVIIWLEVAHSAATGQPSVTYEGTGKASAHDMPQVCKDYFSCTEVCGAHVQRASLLTDERTTHR